MQKLNQGMFEYDSLHRFDFHDLIRKSPSDENALKVKAEMSKNNQVHKDKYAETKVLPCKFSSTYTTCQCSLSLSLTHTHTH